MTSFLKMELTNKEPKKYESHKVKNLAELQNLVQGERPGHRYYTNMVLKKVIKYIEEHKIVDKSKIVAIMLKNEMKVSDIVDFISEFRNYVNRKAEEQKMKPPLKWCPRRAVREMVKYEKENLIGMLVDSHFDDFNEFIQPYFDQKCDKWEQNKKDTMISDFKKNADEIHQESLLTSLFIDCFHSLDQNSIEEEEESIPPFDLCFYM